jgi:hypothetical protein
MSKRMTWDVEPRAGTWAVQREGASRAASLHRRQEDAIARGSALAERNRGQLRIKARDGSIRDERTYGNDPFPPRGYTSGAAVRRHVCIARSVEHRDTRRRRTPRPGSTSTGPSLAEASPRCAPASTSQARTDISIDARCSGPAGGVQPHSASARSSARGPQRSYFASWMRQTGTSRPWNATTVQAVLAQSMSSR